MPTITSARVSAVAATVSALAAVVLLGYAVVTVPDALEDLKKVAEVKQLRIDKRDLQVEKSGLEKSVAEEKTKLANMRADLDSAKNARNRAEEERKRLVMEVNRQSKLLEGARKAETSARVEAKRVQDNARADIEEAQAEAKETRDTARADVTAARTEANEVRRETMAMMNGFFGREKELRKKIEQAEVELAAIRVAQRAYVVKVLVIKAKERVTAARRDLPHYLSGKSLVMYADLKGLKLKTLGYDTFFGTQLFSLPGEGPSVVKIKAGAPYRTGRDIVKSLFGGLEWDLLPADTHRRLQEDIQTFMDKRIEILDNEPVRIFGTPIHLENKIVDAFIKARSKMASVRRANRTNETFAFGAGEKGDERVPTKEDVARAEASHAEAAKTM